MTLSMNKSRSYRAYTLIELLLVIVIIAMLAALLFAVFAPARRQSKEAACLSNLRQMYLATQMYRHDNDGTDPEEGQATTCRQLGTPCTGDQYMNFLRTYIKHKEVGICPADPVAPWSGRLCSYSPTLMTFSGVPSQLQESAIQSGQRVMSALGTRAPMYSCDEYHNPPLDYANAPRDATKRVTLVRYNGSAALVICPVRMFWPYEKVEGR